MRLEEERLTFPTGKVLALLNCLALEVGQFLLIAWITRILMVKNTPL